MLEWIDGEPYGEEVEVSLTSSIDFPAQLTPFIGGDPVVDDFLLREASRLRLQSAQNQGAVSSLTISSDTGGS